MTSPDFTTPDIAASVLAEHRRDLSREASGALRATIVRCCRPSTWAGVARRVSAALARGPRDATVCAG